MKTNKQENKQEKEMPRGTLGLGQGETWNARASLLVRRNPFDNFVSPEHQEVFEGQEAFHERKREQS